MLRERQGDVKPVHTLTVPRHPAKFSAPILAVLNEVVPDGSLILDPFAGVGGIHALQNQFSGRLTVGVELEPEWARAHKRTIIGSALRLPFTRNLFDVIATSPAYGNRMADHHDARDSSRRNTYRHALGRPLSDGSSACLQWGNAYRAFHAMAIVEANRVLKPGGLHIWNVSNHIRKGEEQYVVEWFESELSNVATVVYKTPVVTQRLKQGENHNLRVTNEFVLVYRKLYISTQADPL